MINSVCKKMEIHFTHLYYAYLNVKELIAVFTIFLVTLSGQHPIYPLPTLPLKTITETDTRDRRLLQHAYENRAGAIHG